MALGENIKRMRMAKGLTQQELAVKLNVVRQTVSKWEKGLSVPDSQMLIELAEQLETTVTALLGDEVVQIENEVTVEELSRKLSVINEQLAKSAENRRRLLRGVSIIAAVGAALYGGLQAAAALFGGGQAMYPSSIGIIGGADGPTAIYVSSSFSPIGLLAALAVLIAAVCGICLTRKR